MLKAYSANSNPILPFYNNILNQIKKNSSVLNIIGNRLSHTMILQLCFRANSFGTPLCANHVRSCHIYILIFYLCFTSIIGSFCLDVPQTMIWAHMLEANSCLICAIFGVATEVETTLLGFRFVSFVQPDADREFVVCRIELK